MGMWALLTLAKKMGIDPDEMIKKTEPLSSGRSPAEEFEILE